MFHNHSHSLFFRWKRENIHNLIEIFILTAILNSNILICSCLQFNSQLFRKFYESNYIKIISLEMFSKFKYTFILWFSKVIAFSCRMLYSRWYSIADTHCCNQITENFFFWTFLWFIIIKLFLCFKKDLL